MNSCEHFVCSNIVQLSLINHYFMLLPPVGLPTLLESFLRALSLVCPVERQFQFLLWLCCLCCVLGGALVPPSLTERKEFDRKKTGVVVMQRQNEIHLPSIFYSSKRRSIFYEHPGRVLIFKSKAVFYLHKKLTLKLQIEL